MSALPIIKAQSSVAKAISATRGELTKIRAQISELREERDWLENSPPPKDEVISGLCEWIDYRAGEVSPEQFLSGDSDALRRLMTPNANIEGARFVSIDLSPMLAFLLGDQLKARLAEFIDSVHYECGPPKAERAALVRNIEEQIWELERTEEGVIVELENLGVNISRRQDVDPSIFLEWR